MAAGLGFKDFQTGEVLTAADVDGYLMQGIWVFASTAARDASVTSPSEGNFAFTKDTNSLWYYDGAAWVASGATGDIEGVTAGVGISGGGTSGTVTVTNSMATAIDAKGDLVAGTGADTFSKLTVGANGTILTADSAEATGLKWATPASGSMTLLSTTTLSGTTTTVSSISQSYKNLFIEVYGAVWGTGASSASFSTNHTSTLSYKKVQSTDFGTAQLTTNVNDLDNNIQGLNNTSGDNYINFTFYNYASTTDYKTWQVNGVYRGTDNGRIIQLFGNIASDTAMNQFNFTTVLGYTFSAGTIKVYGVN